MKLEDVKPGMWVRNRLATYMGRAFVMFVDEGECKGGFRYLLEQPYHAHVRDEGWQTGGTVFAAGLDHWEPAPSPESSDSEQLSRWLSGEPVHGEQCCPDFSCCQPHLLAPIEERKLFVERPELRDQLCMGFLSRAFAELGKAVHIAGSIEGEA